MKINHFAVFACALLNLVVGALWYSPVLFGRPWMRVNNLTEEQLKQAKFAPRMIAAFVLSLIMSYNLAAFLGGPDTTARWGAIAGLLTGLGWAAMIFAVIALFELRPVKYVLINGGFIVVYFTLIGFVLGLWR
jgi:hypothetical protein